MSRPVYPYFRGVAPTRTSPTLAEQTVRARAQLSAVTEIGLALRDHRDAEGLSQRELAVRLRLSKTMIGRLESDPSRVPLGTVLAALAPTGYTLRLMDAQEETAASKHWTTADLIAKDLSNRRFPATMDVVRSGFTGIPYRWTRYGMAEPPWKASRHRRSAIGEPSPSSVDADGRASRRGA